MSKRNKKLLSLLLSTMMVFSVVPSTVYAAPEQGTEATVEQDANEEVKQEDTVNNEADASADQADTKQDEAKADDTAQKTDNAATQAGNAAQTVVDARMLPLLVHHLQCQYFSSKVPMLQLQKQW